MYLEIFLADFAVFRVFLGEFRGISRKHLNFAGPRSRELSEALYIVQMFIIELRNWIIPLKLSGLMVTHEGGKLSRVGELSLAEG